MVGFDDYCHRYSVVLIEWADKVESSLTGTNCIRIELAHEGPDERAVKMQELPDYVKLI